MDVAIISCCKSKRDGGEPEYRRLNLLSECLSDNQLKYLLGARYELATMLGLPSGPDLGGNEENGNILFRPAYIRYSGIVYSRAAVAELLPETLNFHLVIISALYGLLDARDSIRQYDLQMGDTLPSRVRVSTWWKRKGLGSIVRKLMESIEPSSIHDLLSLQYRRCLEPWPESPLCDIVNSYSYPGLGSGSIWRRGDDLKHLLLSHKS